MNRKLAVFVAALAAFAFVTQAAEAGGRRKVDPRLSATAVGVGAASTAAYFAFNNWNWKWDSARAGVTSMGAYAITTVGCAALSPIVGTAVMHRPLTYREAHILVGSCLIPVVGGWLVNEAYNEGILWAPDEQQPVAVKKHRKRHVATK
ncbi:hypothetical protein DW352_00645 [Pseudolabrys taiwanensis]|uniref:Uncharacterized protein n=1 Tax=Pseudolabrys taiwanensis TaxID=331696 RepID=A0A345ZQF6_9HYPH|nr:hypothetical protein [Pseudolabrys taiwanensis]AXK79153.1 hypothetical protein DW352_00645 [Pseudolabrys taiwanensis]